MHRPLSFLILSGLFGLAAPALAETTGEVASETTSEATLEEIEIERSPGLYSAPEPEVSETELEVEAIEREEPLEEETEVSPEPEAPSFPVESPSLVIPEVPVEPEEPLEPSETNERGGSEPEEVPFEEMSLEEQRFHLLREGDRHYIHGEIEAAEAMYRQAKGAFAGGSGEGSDRPPAFSDPELLSPGAAVYWNQSQVGIEQNLQTKIFVPLELLVAEYPEFVPGHLRYAELLREYDRTQEARAVLERANAAHPDDPDLTRATVDLLAAEEDYLEASIIARQFALLHPNTPGVEEMHLMADEHLARFQKRLKRKLTGRTIATIFTGAVSVVLTGSPIAALPALESTFLLVRGEEKLGDRITASILEQLPIVRDEIITGYVNDIGQELARYAGRDFDYEFHVIRDDSLNAFALPGGKIFVHTGAILATKSEAELAGLLAHEISHAVLSHGLQRVTKSNLIANFTNLIPFGGLANNLLVLDYSREQERQADVLGTRILAGSTYAADGLRNLMLTLERQAEERGTIPSFLSTHPSGSKRVRELEELIEENNYNRYRFEGVERHQQVQDRLKWLQQRAAEDTEVLRVETEADSEFNRQRRVLDREFPTRDIFDRDDIFDRPL